MQATMAKSKRIIHTPNMMVLHTCARLYLCPPPAVCFCPSLQTLNCYAPQNPPTGPKLLSASAPISLSTQPHKVSLVQPRPPAYPTPILAPCYTRCCPMLPASPSLPPPPPAARLPQSYAHLYSCPPHTAMYPLNCRLLQLLNSSLQSNHCCRPPP